MIYLKLFLAFLKVGVFSIGGGYAAVPVIRSQAVDGFGWINLNEFTDLISIAEMTPGPITINSATFIGVKIAGVPGALAATAGCVLPSLIIVSLMFFIYSKYGKLNASRTVLSYIRPAVVALIASAGISVLMGVIGSGDTVFTAVPFNITALVLFAAGFVLLRKFKVNPIIIMAGCGTLYLAINTILVR